MRLSKTLAIGLALWFCYSVAAQEKAPLTPAPATPPRLIRFLSDLDSPPFAWKEGAKVVGFEIELGESLGKELGAEVKWIQAPFDFSAYVNSLKTNQADAVLSSMSITEKRKWQVAFTRPYFRTSLALATREGSKEAVRLQYDKRRLEDSALGVMKGTTGEEWARKNLRAQLKTYASAVLLARALDGGEVLAILIDEDILNYVLSGYAYKFKVIARDLDHEEYGIAVSKDNRQLLDDLSAALRRINTSGIYGTIYHQWFGHRENLPRQK